jgi:Mg-chelatase subunit ChlD
MTLRTELIYIVDRSGSMDSIRDSVIEGYNKSLRDHQAEEGEARVTFVQFDDIVETVYEARTVKEAPFLSHNSFQPRGSTALNDGIGQTLEAQAKRIAKEKWAEMVIVTIITDGGENASKNYTADRVKGLTAMAQNLGWEFVFQAANQDAFATAQNYAFAAKGVKNFEASVAGSASAFADNSLYTRSLRKGDLNTKI